MWDPSHVERPGLVDYVRRSAACLGALGYSPHEVVCIVATQLNVNHDVVAEALRDRATGSEATAA